MLTVSTFTSVVEIELSGSNVKELKYEVIIKPRNGVLVLARSSSKKDANKFINHIKAFKP